MKTKAMVRCPCCNRAFIVYESTDAATCGQQAFAIVPEEKTAAND